jgi:hypothetical protein
VFSIGPIGKIYSQARRLLEVGNKGQCHEERPICEGKLWIGPRMNWPIRCRNLESLSGATFDLWQTAGVAILK